MTLRALELANVLLAVGCAHAALAVRLAAREVAHVLAAVGPPLPPGAIDLAAVELACGAHVSQCTACKFVEHQSESNPRFIECNKTS